MSNTVTLKNRTIEISAIDSDWSWSDNFADRDMIPINFIQFNPAAVSDKCVVKEGSDAGPASFYATCASADDQKRAYYYGCPMQPVLDFDAGTFTAGSSVIIQLAG